jgi:hopanoid biosynthesis associated protein HpnK
MRRLLIVNADDLGLHEDINRGIYLAHSKGIVTSTSLVACGEAFADASAMIQECPDLDVGVHLTLIEERPLSSPREVPGLVGADGRFLPSYRRLTARVLGGRVSPGEVRKELRAQIERVVATGRRPSHLDGHQHVHVLPMIWRVVTELASEYGIRWIRIPRFPALWRARKSLLDPVFRLGFNVLSARVRLSSRGRLIARTPGLHLSGRLREADLLGMIPRLRPGISELVSHPGVQTPALASRYRWNYQWNSELAAVTSPGVVSLVQASGVQLIRFSEC